MSSTNKTAELHLSQFIGTDIPSILTDYNGDMQKIDAGVREVKQATAGAVSDLSSVTARVTNAEQDISGLNSTVQGIATRVVGAEGDIDALETSVANVQTAVNTKADANAVTALQGDVDNIEDVIPASASSSNKLVAQNAFDSQIGEIEDYTHKLIASVSNSGNETLASMLYRLSDSIDSLDDIQIVNLKLMLSDGTVARVVKRSLSPLSVTFVSDAKRDEAVTTDVPIGYFLFNTSANQQKCFAYSLLDAIMLEGSSRTPNYSYSDLSNVTTYSTAKLFI